MAYDRYYEGQRDPRDLSADSRDTYSSARDYEAAGLYDRGRSGRGWDDRPTGYYGRNDGFDRGQARGQSYGQRDYGRQDRFGGGNYREYGSSEPYRGSYAADGHRFTDVEDYGREYRRDFGFDRQADNRGQRHYGRQPQGYNYQERGFLDRAGDEVRSWFGDEDAERRREADARADQRFDRDHDYGSWRRGQIAALDRDYDEYRQENRTKFENEFSSWRTERQGQRNSLNSVSEHMEVVGSDGSHVGTVDKVRGDRIVLTKSDADAGGRHHSIPSRWIDQVSDKVTLRKTADEAQAEWRDEERNQALFGDNADGDRNRTIVDDRGAHVLNRSFSGTY